MPVRPSKSWEGPRSVHTTFSPTRRSHERTKPAGNTNLRHFGIIQSVEPFERFFKNIIVDRVE